VSRRRPPQYDLPKAAPGRLRLVQVLVNTTDGHERELLPEWLAGNDISATSSALARAREMREALRALLVVNNEGGRPPAEAVATLEEAAARAHVSIELAPPELVALAPGVDGLLGQVVAAAFECMRDGSWPRLKACRNCHWAFYDESRNRSAAWCSMQLCGNRLKTSAYRRRKRAIGV
jgi:predicted RNA-binding Zn ribbon-like protein